MYVLLPAFSFSLIHTFLLSVSSRLFLCQVAKVKDGRLDRTVYLHTLTLGFMSRALALQDCPTKSTLLEEKKGLLGRSSVP